MGSCAVVVNSDTTADVSNLRDKERPGIMVT